MDFDSEVGSTNHTQLKH